MSIAPGPTATTAAAWRLLSLGFSVPSEEGLEEVEALAEALRERGGRDEELDALLGVLRVASLDELAARHQALFGGTVLVAPYEGSYELDPVRQGREMADVAAFYRAFGAEAHGPAHERPDHAGCELEFLSFLELRRLETTGEDAELAGEILSAFLRDHAGRWLPTFFADVRAAAVSPFHSALAALALRVVREELERYGVEPTPVRRRHSRLAVEGDSFDCA
jgi:putative dimethyl sulfoxide reductase chaperone